MAQVLIRNVDEETVESYRHKAKIKGISLEQELRNLLEAHKPLTVDKRIAVSRRLREQFALEEWDAKAAIRWGRDDDSSTSKPASMRHDVGGDASVAVRWTIETPLSEAAECLLPARQTLIAPTSSSSR